jgi:hypothetical protein
MADAPTAADPSLFTGRLEQAGDGRIVLAIPHTDYRLHLETDSPPPVEPGKPLRGRILADAKRVDRVRTGGRYIEPLMGRPRRLQGTVKAADPAANTITVHCGCPFVCELTDDRQRADQFEAGQLVSFDIERGARFEAM